MEWTARDHCPQAGNFHLVFLQFRFGDCPVSLIITLWLLSASLVDGFSHLSPTHIQRSPCGISFRHTRPITYASHTAAPRNYTRLTASAVVLHSGQEPDTGGRGARSTPCSSPSSHSHPTSAGAAARARGKVVQLCIQTDKQRCATLPPCLRTRGQDSNNTAESEWKREMFIKPVQFMKGCPSLLLFALQQSHCSSSEF